MRGTYRFLDSLASVRRLCRSAREHRRATDHNTERRLKGEHGHGERNSDDEGPELLPRGQAEQLVRATPRRVGAELGSAGGTRIAGRRNFTPAIASHATEVIAIATCGPRSARRVIPCEGSGRLTVASPYEQPVDNNERPRRQTRGSPKLAGSSRLPRKSGDRSRLEGPLKAPPDRRAEERKSAESDEGHSDGSKARSW